MDARGHLTRSTLTTVAAWRVREEDLATATARTEATRLAKRVLALDLELVSMTTPFGPASMRRIPADVATVGLRMCRL